MELVTLGGNWVDLIIILFLLSSLFEGWRRGFLGGLFDLLGFLLSFLLALRFYPSSTDFLVSNFFLSVGIAKAAGFFAIAFLSEIILGVLLGWIYSRLSLKITRLAPNRFLGFLPAVGETLILIAVLLSLILALPVKGVVKRDILSSKLGRVIVSQTQGLERQFGQIFGAAVEETINFFTIKPQSEEKVDLRFTQKELTIDETSEKDMFQLVNQERKTKGLKELVWDSEIQMAARSHAKDMFERGYFAHINPEGLTPADRLTGAGISFTVTGENLALAPGLEIAHRGLMESLGHRANILSADFGRVGIGVIDGGVYGKMFVQEFAN